MEEKYGVELQLITDKFNSNFNKIKNMMKEFSIEAKKNFTTGVNIDTDRTEKELDTLERKIKESVEVSKKQLEELNNAKVDLSGLYNKRDSGLYKGVARGNLENDIVSKQLQVSNLSRQLEVSNQTVRNYTSAYRELNGDLERTETKMGILGTVVGNLKRTFQGIGSYIKTGFGKDTKQQIEDINVELNNTGKAGRSAGNGISSMMSNGVKSLKRFALSLFGIQSIWRVLSRASSAYMQQNTELASKMQSIWNGLGTLIGPVIDYLADIFMKLLGYINVITKALFNFDFVAKTNANTLKNYQKQISKTSKAFAGIDELTNINQQTSEDTGPKGLIEIPELDRGIVSFLEDLSKALKDNWDWLQWVVYGLGLAFGASAVAGWIGNIGKLLGIGGSGGLLGLSSVLSTLLTIGTIAIGVDLFYKAITGRDLINDLKDIIKEYKELKDAQERNSKNNSKLHSDFKTIIKDKKQEAKTYEKGSQEIAQYTGSLKSVIDGNLEVIKSTSALSDEYKYAVEEIELTVDAYKELYESGQLTERQTQTFTDYMAKLGYNVDGTNMSFRDYIKYVKELGDRTEFSSTVVEKLGFKASDTADIIASKVDETAQKSTQGINDMFGTIASKISEATNASSQKVNTMVADIGNKLKNPFTIFFNTQEIEQNIPNKVNNMLADIGNKLKNAFTITFHSVVKVPDLTQVQNIINSVFGKLGVKAENGWVSAFGTRLFRIPGFAVGTDLVKSDGLAYIHAGEQIVPAKAVSGGWTGAGNEDTNNLLRQLIEVVYEKDFSATISSDDIGKASVNYIRNQNRLRGGSVI